ncbi:ABC transporter substrate-binding protein [Actinoplanes sp. NPDC026619]|uniref:ABC transporter substrate-binding protein n=1 Tax=Actinoplanes sp. NPDC026619 TaxID=3155798 RepID=UPI0033CC91C3
MSPVLQPPPRRTTRRSVLAGAVALIAGGALAACGGSSGTASTKAADGSTTVTVLRSTGSTFEPLYIAEQQGYFKAAGLTVTIKAGAQDTSQNAPSVLNGEAEFAMTDSSGFLKAAAQKLPVRVVSNLQAATTKTPPSDGLLVKKDSPIKSYADLEGKTVGLAALGGTLQFICEYSTKQAGGDPSKIKFVALPLTSLNDAVQQGKVDAVYTFATFLDAGKAAGLTAIGQGTNALPGLPQALLFSSQAWLAKNADTAKKFTDAISKAIDYANANPDAVRAVDTQYTQLPADYIKNRTIQQFSAPIDTGVMQTVITNMVDFGLLKAAPDSNSLLWDQAATTTNSQ